MARPLGVLLLNTTHLEEELESLGHTVISAAPPKLHHFKRKNLFFKPHRYDFAFDEGESLDTVLERLPADFNLDVILYYDDSSPFLYLHGIEHSPVPTIFYSIDAHIHSTWHPMYAGIFDKILVAMKDYGPSFQRYNANVEWLPLWAPLMIEPAEEKTIDVCFRGSLDRRTRERRVKFFERLRELVDVDAAGGAYQEPYSKSKIVINEVLDGDVNCKVFESMMCGGLLLNPRTGNGLLDMFQDGVHLVTYEDDNETDCAEKIRYYLAHDEERKRIAEAGRNEILRRHIPIVRAADLERHLETVQVSERRTSAFCAAFLDYLTCQIRKHHYNAIVQNRFVSCYGHMLEHATSGAPAYESSIYLAAACKEVLETMGSPEAAEDMLKRLCKAYPDQHPLGILWFDTLVKMGRADEVRANVAEMVADPEDFLRHIPELVGKLKEASYLTNEAFEEYLGKKDGVTN